MTCRSACQRFDRAADGPQESLVRREMREAAEENVFGKEKDLSWPRFPALSCFEKF